MGVEITMNTQNHIIIIIIIISFVSTTVFSISAGETSSYHFSECKSELIANITASQSIDDNEYLIVNSGCNETSQDYYVCACNGSGYDFVISFHYASENEYTIYFNYDYDREVTKDTSSSSSSNGNIGGGISGQPTTSLLINTPQSYTLSKGYYSKFKINSVYHSIILKDIFNNTVLIEIHSNIINTTLNVGETKQYNLNNNSYYDLSIKLDNISNNKAKITLTKINKSIQPITDVVPADVIVPDNNKTPVTIEQPPIDNNQDTNITALDHGGSSTLRFGWQFKILIGLLVFILIIGGIAFLFFKDKDIMDDE